MLDKDFYDKVNDSIKASLESLIDTFGNEDWFPEAWNRYREYVLSTTSSINPPSYTFNLYVPRSN